MSDFPSFQEFLKTSSSQVPALTFFINLFFAAIITWFLKIFYINYGNSLSNRVSFSKNFIPLTLITTLIISVIKSSLALSLGLVGALSIVRFRVAIKEPEEIIYLFLCIAIGLGFGADQGTVTTLAFIFYTMVISIENRYKNYKVDNNLHISVSSEKPDKKIFEKVSLCLKQHCKTVILKRMDESNDKFEASFHIDFHSSESLNEARKEILKIDKSINILFFDIDPSL